MDLQSFIGSPQGFIGEQRCFLPDPLWEVVDSSKLRRRDRDYADQVFHLTCAALAFAIVETLHNPTQTAQVREMTKTRMDLLRYGGAAEEYKEAAI